MFQLEVSAYCNPPPNWLFKWVAQWAFPQVRDLQLEASISPDSDSEHPCSQPSRALGHCGERGEAM